MKKIFITLLVLLLAKALQAQNSLGSNAQSIKVNTLQPLVFNYNDLNELEFPKTLYNALHLELKAKAETAIISANVNYTSPAEPALSNKLVLKYSSGNSSSAVINMADIPLTSVPVQLLQQPTFGNGVDHYSFYYNVILQPVTNFVAQEDNYFVITFTLTNP